MALEAEAEYKEPEFMICRPQTSQKSQVLLCVSRWSRAKHLFPTPALTLKCHLKVLG